MEFAVIYNLLVNLKILTAIPTNKQLLLVMFQNN